MSVEEIQALVSELSERELADFAGWFEGFLEAPRGAEAGGGKLASRVQEEGPGGISAEKLAEVERRREAFLRAPESGRSWEQVKAFARAGRD